MREPWLSDFSFSELLRHDERKKALEKRRERISSMYPGGEDMVNIIPWVVYLVAYSKALSFEEKIVLFTFIDHQKKRLVIYVQSHIMKRCRVLFLLGNYQENESVKN